MFTFLIYSLYRVCVVLIFSDHECGQYKQIKFWHIKTKSNKWTDKGSILQHIQTPTERPCGSHGSWSLKLVHSWSFLRVAVPIKIFCKSAGTVETITDKQNNVNVTYCIEWHENSKDFWGKTLIRRVLRYQSVYQRRTNNTKAKRKSTNGQTTIYKTHTYS